MNEKEIFYKHHPSTHNLRAPSVVVPIINDLFAPQSVIDVGCGIGTWLKVFKDLGVKEILGLDGDNVNRKDLLIDQSFFRVIDFREETKLEKRFDLVLCLEVAEHLNENKAESFVNLLSSLGNVVVFSAAIPGQGGQNHLNEQWLNYWVDKFYSRGFKYYDVIRPLIWNSPDVDFWYKQNIVVFSNADFNFEKEAQYVNLVHPILLDIKNSEIFALNEKINNPDILASLKNLIRAMLRRL